MPKTSGLGDDAWIAGYHIGGDIRDVAVNGGPALIDVTDITQSAHSRIGGQRDGHMSLTSYMDVAAGQSHAAFSSLPRTDVILTYCRGQAIGNPAACLNAKQLNYDPTRSNTGDLTFKVDADGDAYGLEWGVQLTAGQRTDTGAANGAPLDGGGGFTTPAVPASTVAATNTTSLSASVVISGGTLTSVVVNGVQAGTADGTYTVPAGGTISVTYTVAPTWTWTLSSGFGAQAYLQAASFTGTDVTVTIQDSADNSTFANVTGLAFTQITGGTPLAQRIAGANNATIRRYLRVITTTSGGFTSLGFQVTVVRNMTSGQVF